MKIVHDELERRAAASLSSTPRPFLRWAGSKRRFLSDLVPLLPSRLKTYYEPFLGGGALFFLLRPTQAVLGDLCNPLVDTYFAVRDNPHAVLRYLRAYSVDKETYYRVRGNPSTGRFKKAAQFIYLNKTCWNGLYRVNSRGEFNVPYGRPRTSNIIDESNLLAAAEVLRGDGVSIATNDFETTVAGAGSGDLVFLDPPYVTGHENNGFVDYNEVLFSWFDQERLANAAREAVSRGARVLVTNAEHRSVRQLYRGFEAIPMEVHRTISGKMKTRRQITELVLVGGAT